VQILTQPRSAIARHRLFEYENVKLRFTDARAGGNRGIGARAQDRRAACA
jgi:hypothetical protein